MSNDTIENLRRRLEREWRVIDPESEPSTPVARELAQEHAPVERRRIRVGRVD